MIVFGIFMGFILGVGVTTVVAPPAEKPEIICLKSKGVENCYEIRRDND